MPIKISVTGDTPLEALASLAAFGIRCMANDDVAKAANCIFTAEAHKEAKEAKEAAAVATNSPPEPYVEDPPFPQQDAEAPGKAEEPPADPTPAPQPAEAAGGGAASGSTSESPAQSAVASGKTGNTGAAPGTETKPPKLEEVRAAGIEAAKTHGQAAVKKILEKYGVPNMTSLAEGDRAAFLEDLKGLGEANA